MIVLGFDTATRSSAVGLRMADGATLRARDDPREGEHPGHATRLLGMAGELLATAGLSFGDLDRVAVGVGPGRFTGLRVGVATARGLAQSLSLELVGVSSLRALAEAALPGTAGGGARAAAPSVEEARGQDGPPAVIAVIDARRGEAFATARCITADGPAREFEFPLALTPTELERVVERAELLGAQSGQRWLAVGDGALRFRDQLESAGATVAPDESALHLVDGGAICLIGASTPAAASFEDVVPDYRRPPDARASGDSPAVAESVTT